MGYHVTVLRTRAGARVPIRREEVEAVVRARPDLGMTEGEGGGLTLHAAGSAEESPFALWYDPDGEIWTKNPDDDTLALMIALAEALGGRVRGDELETYRTPEESYQHPDDAAEQAEAEAEARALRRRMRRKQWWVNGALLAVLVLLGLLAQRCSGHR